MIKMLESVSQNTTRKPPKQTQTPSAPSPSTSKSVSNNKIPGMATHEKKRKIAVKCLELEEMLENQG